MSQEKCVRHLIHAVDSFSFSAARCNEAIRNPMAKARGAIVSFPPKRDSDSVQSQSMHLYTERRLRDLQIEWDEHSWECCCTFTSCIFQTYSTGCSRGFFFHCWKHSWSSGSKFLILLLSIWRSNYWFSANIYKFNPKNGDDHKACTILAALLIPFFLNYISSLVVV
jgi:hypothetical protein